MNLNSFNLSAPAELGATIVIKHPLTGEDTDITIDVVGKDSATYRNALKRITEQPLPEDPDEKEKELVRRGAELMCTCIRGWSGIEDEEGEEIPFSVEFCMELLSNIEFDSFNTQVNAAIHDRTNYHKKKEKN